jgi:hypothetical protein
MLLAALCFLNRDVRADPPAAPQQGVTVKTFDVTVPRSTVPGFGNVAPAAASDELRPTALGQVGPTGRAETAPGPARLAGPALPSRSADAQASPLEKSAAAAKRPVSSTVKSYRTRSPYERTSFPSGVPEWFKQRDANFDGQVFMWEYASSWTDESAQAFGQLDVNGDGVITALESVARRELAVEPVRAGISSSRRFSSAPMISKANAFTIADRAPPAKSAMASATAAAPAGPSPTEAAVAAPSALAPRPMPQSIPPSFVTYAEGVIQRFDADRDGALTTAEWAAMPAAPAAADTDGNGRITASELAVWYVIKR